MHSPQAGQQFGARHVSMHALTSIQPHLKSGRMMFRDGPVTRVIFDRLIDDVAERRIAVLTAPVASGKSAILAQLTRNMDQSHEIISPHAANQMSDHIKNAFDRAAAIGGEAARKVLIVIDDAHDFPQDRLREIVAAFEQSRNAARPAIIIATNSNLPLSLSSLRLRGELANYGLADLALTHGEAGAFVGATMSDMLTPGFRSLMSQTSGWVGAWSLIREAFKKGSGFDAIARWMHGDVREISSYFEENILQGLDPALQRFICLMAPVWPLATGSVQTIFGDTGPKLLYQAQDACAFLGTQSPGGTVPRPNQLFCEFLICRAKREWPAEQRRIFQAAANWFEEQTDWPRAAQYHVQAGNRAHASHLLTEKADEIFARFGDIVLVQDGGMNMLGRLASIEYDGPATHLIRGTVMRGSEVGAAGGSERLVDILTDFGRDNRTEVRAAADKWLAASDGDALHRATIANALAVTHLAELRMIDMQHALEQATSASLRAHSPFLHAWSVIGWSFFHLERGQPLEGKRLLLNCLHDTAVRGLMRHTLELVLANCEWQLGYTELARDLVHANLDLASRHATIDTMALGWTTTANAICQSNGAAEAIEMLQVGARIAGRRSGARSQCMVRLFGCHLKLREFGTSCLSEVLEEFDKIAGLSANAGFGKRYDEQVRMVSARIALVAGRTEEACKIVQPILHRTRTSNRMLRWTEAMVIRIGAAIADGENTLASSLFWECDDILPGGGLRQMLMDEARLLAPITPLLVEQSRLSGFRQDQHDFAKAIASGNAYGNRHPTVQHPSHVTGLSKLLTRKEQSIMRLVKAGLSNDDIGARLGISAVTVKWHLRNLFQKLQVKSRTAAVAKLSGSN